MPLVQPSRIPQIYSVTQSDHDPANKGEGRPSSEIFGKMNRNPNKGRRIAMLWLGWFLLIIAPIVGAIPGPGFIIIFPIGLALVLKNSRWAKVLYIKFKRKWPEYGRWTDWVLRRKGQKEMPQLPPIKEQIKSLLGRKNPK